MPGLSTVQGGVEQGMTRILYIIPYISSQQQFERIIATMSIPENVHFELVQATEVDTDAAGSWDNDLVIARGMTYDAVRRNARNAQTIEIAVTGYDIIRAVKQTVEQFKARRIALILTHNIYIDARFIEEIFHIKIDFFQIRNPQEAEQVFNRIHASGLFDAIVSGGTVSRIAAKAGFHSVTVIETGDEGVKNAINEALAAIHASRAEKSRNELISTMIESIGDGVVAIDQNQSILFMNDVCRRLFHVGDGNIQGKKIEEYLGDWTVYDNPKSRSAGDSTIRKINGRMMVIKLLPINVEGTKEGAILTLQSVDRLQKTEIDIRQKLSQKGLVAKYHFEEIVGSSTALRKAVESAKRYAKTDHDILIVGETGTGKELFAQSIHNYSTRREQPFVAFNCATISENLLESELFGYVEGAFTGAVKGGRIGLFELAHKGTLFMDEIAELPIALQAKLLRVLQEKEIRKLGDDKIIPIDVRVIAATNVSLRTQVEKGSFREDLLYRLDILSLFLPPLRQRSHDIVDLVQLFTEQHNRENRERRQLVIEPDAIAELERQDWMGNIRELKNICDRIFVLNSTGVVTREDVREALMNGSLDLGRRTPDAWPAMSAIKSPEPPAIPMIDGRKATKEELARMLGISRTTLWRRSREK